MTFIDISVSLSDIANGTEDHLSEMMNEYGRATNDDIRKKLDPNDLDACGVQFIETLHAELTAIKATGWKP